MGKDAQVEARFPDGPDQGCLQHEPPRLLFRGAQRRVYQGDDLNGVRAEAGDLVPAMAEKGAIWVVSRKGKAAAVKDIEVMAAAKAVGLVDNKVVGFSETLTALRFTRRRP